MAKAKKSKTRSKQPPPDNRIFVRLGNEDRARLDTICLALGFKKSKAVRYGLIALAKAANLENKPVEDFLKKK